MSTFHYQKRFKMVRRFYSGITKLCNESILHYMLPCKHVKSPLSDWKAFELINIAYEAGSTDVCQIVGNYFKNSSSVINLDALESHAIKFVLTHYTGLLQLHRDGLKVVTDWTLQHSNGIILNPLEDIVVQNCNNIYEIHINKSSHIKLMTQVLSASKTLDVLHIDAVNVKYDQIKCLTNETSNSLSDFKMIGCGLNPSKVDIIREILSYCKSIRSVDLSNNCIADDDVEKLVPHLMSKSMLHHVDLSKNKITEIGISHLRKLFTRDNPTVTSIELSDNPLKDQGVELLLQSLTTGMEHVGLCHVEMTSLACQSLGDTLCKIKSISFNHVNDFTITSATSNHEQLVADNYLEMINNYIKLNNSNYLSVITANLSITTILEHLEIKFICIDLTICKLINAIAQNKSIKTLKFYNDAIEYELTDDKAWVTELAQCVQHNTSLSKLIISGASEPIPRYLIELLTDSLAVNTSIKSMIYEVDGADEYGLDIRNICDFINKLKENSVLENLTLCTHGYVEDEEFLEIENCIQQLNKSRDTIGIAYLKVNVTNRAT